MVAWRFEGSKKVANVGVELGAALRVYLDTELYVGHILFSTRVNIPANYILLWVAKKSPLLFHNVLIFPTGYSENGKIYSYLL